MAPWSRPVAIVPLRGAIGVSVRATDFIPLFDSLRKRRTVKAVVVDIDSPGGAVSGSARIHEALARLAAEKPVIAFSGELCASGGYLIACAARRFVVQPAAVIGSIGVISVHPVAVDFLRRHGLDVRVTKTGALKDSGAFWRAPNEQDIAKEEALVGEFFNLFLERIESGRKMDPIRIRELATGEVFSGRQGVANGLADQLGDLDDAVELAAREAGVRPRSRWYGVRRPLRARVLGSFASQLADQFEERLLGTSRPRF